MGIVHSKGQDLHSPYVNYPHSVYWLLLLGQFTAWSIMRQALFIKRRPGIYTLKFSAHVQPGLYFVFGCLLSYDESAIVSAYLSVQSYACD